MGLRGIGRALAHRNFRLFVFGQGISLVGTWMQQLAMIWLVYSLTRSPLLLGVVGFCAQVPTFLVTPLAGVFSDRWNRRRTLLVTQSLAMLQAALLALLSGTGVIAVWHIVVLSIFLGIVNAFDIPTRQSFLVEMVQGREDLANAIALNSSMFNAARLVGPSLAGVVIRLVGEPLCFLLNAVSFLAVLASLLAMRVAPRPAAAPPAPLLRGLGEGFRYALGFAPIRLILSLLALVNLAAIPLTIVLMPLLATDVFHGGADTLGLLTAAQGVGALVGALLLASRNSVLGLGRVIALTAGGFGAGMICLAYCNVLWLSLLLLAVIGLVVMIETAASNTILQTIVEDDKRGRVMSMYTMAFMGIAPLGSLLAGFLAEHIGAPATIVILGTTCMLGAALFSLRLPALRGAIRPIYQRAGILPEVSSAIESVVEMHIPPED
jgi:MFS family permease